MAIQVDDDGVKERYFLSGDAASTRCQSSHCGFSLSRVVCVCVCFCARALRVCVCVCVDVGLQPGGKRAAVLNLLKRLFRM